MQGQCGGLYLTLSLEDTRAYQWDELINHNISLVFKREVLCH